MPKQIYFLAALFWTGIILFFCLVQLNNVPFESVSNLDKLVHTFFYFVFTVLWFLFFKKQYDGLNNSKLLTISFALSVVFGIIIEIFQELFTATRHADFLDILANLTGTILAIIVIDFLKNHKVLNKI